jgi:phage terminase large subunit GpA-like protein
MQTRLEFYDSEVQVLSALPEEMATTEWARRYIVVPEGPAKGTPYRADYSPMIARLFEWIELPSVRKLLVAASPQSGKTLFGQAFIARRAKERPGPRMVAMPDETTAKRWMDRKLKPLFEKSPQLRKLLGQDRFDLTGTEITLANGSSIVAAWAGSKSQRASISVLDLLLDEPDMYPDLAIKDFEERTRSYSLVSKTLMIGKPIGTENQSRFWKKMEREAQLRLIPEVRCPHCGTYQQMRFENLKVPDGLRDTSQIRANKLAWYECPHCRSRWHDRDRDVALRGGRLRPDKKVSRPEVVAVHLPSWYSPWVSLSEIMADWFEAQGDPEAMTNWWNGHGAQPSDQVITETDETRLQRLVAPELPPQSVPEGTTALTCMIDTQKDHFWWSICAHQMAPREDVIIDYGKAGSFDDLRELVFHSRYMCADGRELPIWRAGIDTGGTRHFPLEDSRTMQVYSWLLSCPPGVVFGTKGMSRKDPGVSVKFKMLSKLPNGKPLRNGLRLYLVDVDAFKDLVFWRLSEETTEPIRFHSATSTAYFRQLLAEKKVMEKGKEVWKQIRRDNHYLDCLVGHQALTHWQWTPSLQVLAQQLAPQTPKKATPPRRNPYTNGQNLFAR